MQLVVGAITELSQNRNQMYEILRNGTVSCGSHVFCFNQRCHKKIYAGFYIIQLSISFIHLSFILLLSTLNFNILS